MNAPDPARRRRVTAVVRRCVVPALVLALAVPAAASAAGLPPQGVYEGCPPGTTDAELQPCVDRLRRIHDAGFEIVLNYSALSGSPDEVRAYAAAADRLGVRLIWPLHHPDLYSKSDVSDTFPAMSSACGCSSPHDLIPFMVGVVRAAPATFMYYVGDETPADRHEAMAANSRLVAASDPAHARLYVSMEYSNFGANLEPFADDADVLAGDTYPVGTSDRLEDVADATRAVQGIADAHGRQAASVLQAFSWGPDYDARPERWPTPAEYRTMRDLALTAGRPRFILWWAAYVIFRAPDAERRWSDLVAGAMAPPPPAPVPPAPAPPALTPVAADAAPSDEVPMVRRVSATRRRDVVRVHFALTRAAKTTVAARRGRRWRTKVVLGRRSLRAVSLRVGSRSRRVTVRVTPAGGRAVRVRVARRPAR